MALEVPSYIVLRRTKISTFELTCINLYVRLKFKTCLLSSAPHGYNTLGSEQCYNKKKRRKKELFYLLSSLENSQTLIERQESFVLVDFLTMNQFKMCCYTNKPCQIKNILLKFIRYCQLLDLFCFLPMKKYVYVREKELNINIFFYTRDFLDLNTEASVCVKEGVKYYHWFPKFYEVKVGRGRVRSQIITRDY